MASLKKTTQISKSTQKINKESTIKTPTLVQPRIQPTTIGLRSSSKDTTLKKSHSFMRSTAC